MSDTSSLLVKKNVNLQKYNTLTVPSVAEYFCEIRRIADIHEVMSFLHEKKCKVMTIGGGSNLILSDVIDGLVVKNSLVGRNIIEETKGYVIVEFAAGENWHDSVMWSVNQGYYGLENLALIPGSVGAAPIQNIGAYGVELESCFEFLCGIDLTTEQEVTLRREDCQFGYRDSIFKHALKDKIIITSVALKLSKVPELVLDYPALAQSIDQSATSVSAKQVAETVIAIRQSKLPDPIDVPNAGSFYKNPIVLEKKYSALKNEYPELVAYPLGSGQYKLAAGWLLDKAGWKGKVIDGINMHDKQALVLTNPYHASGKTILDFSERLCQSIQDQFGVSLEIEPQIY